MDQWNSSSETAGANVLKTSGDVDHTKPYTEIHLADGRILHLDTRHLGVSGASTESADALATGGPSEVAIPLIEEQLTIGKRTVPTGKVTLQKTVQDYEHQLNEPLALRTYDIERKVLNQPVDVTPSVRHEGETTVYPIVEEQLILTKQLILKEEIYVKLRDDIKVDTQVVTLRREHLAVERASLSSE